MSDFPDDADAEGYAYVRLDVRNRPHGHFKMYFALPGLRRAYPLDPVDLVHTAQFGGIEDVKQAERSYAWRLLACDWSDGLTAANLPRVHRTVMGLQKGMDKLAMSAGPVSMLEDHLCRLIVVSKVKYVYMPQGLNDGGSIPHMACWTPRIDGLVPIHDRLKYLKTLMVAACP